MPKNSVKQIEQDEKRILGELLKNANKSINDIAENCRFSRQKVWRVIKNLEKNHTIWGYTTVVDEEKLNNKGYILFIKRNNKTFPDKLIKKIIDRDLTNNGKKIDAEITNSFFTHGIYDWVICFNANDIREAKSFIEEVNKLYGEYISESYLIEKMFTAVSSRVTNPEIKKLNDFFKV